MSLSTRSATAAGSSVIILAPLTTRMALCASSISMLLSGEADVDLGGLALDARAQGVGVHVGKVVRGDVMPLEGAAQPREKSW